MFIRLVIVSNDDVLGRLRGRTVSGSIRGPGFEDGGTAGGDRTLPGARLDWNPRRDHRKRHRHPQNGTETLRSGVNVIKLFDFVIVDEA